MNDPQADKGVKRGRRWLPPIFLLIFGWLTLVYAPVIPYSPTCFEKGDFWIVEGKLSQVFANKFTGFLQAYKVDYLYYGGNIFLRQKDWLDYEDWVTNAKNKSIRTLVKNSWEAKNGRLPEKVQKLMKEISDAKSGDFQTDNCNLMRAVAIDGW